MAKFSGGCVCGAVRDCQHVSGGGYAAVAGGENVRGFCASCGSRISGGRSPDSLGILAGSLDDPSVFHPTMDIQVADAQPWDLLSPATRKFERYPTA